MQYIGTAELIFNWLAGFQVQSRKIRADRFGDDITFSLTHPTEGDIEMRTMMGKDAWLQCHGIGLKIVGRSTSHVDLEIYDGGGIFDPLDFCVPGDHYAATHFALLGGLLYREKGDSEILQKVQEAMAFHLRTAPDEYRFGDWGYHWDFQNFAFIEAFRLLKDDLSDEERASWVKGLKSWKENRKNWLTNWTAMRAYSAFQRHALTGKLFDNGRANRWLRQVHQARQKDGCYDDHRNVSRPIQYHAFTMAMLHRILQIHPDGKLEKYFLEGVRYLLPFIDPEGCFNYVGRGQEQIFGYGAAIYALEAASQLDAGSAEKYRACAGRLWHYLRAYQRPDGSFPLVLNKRLDEERFGWYDYHHSTVYNAFLGVWLGLAHELNAGPVHPKESLLISKQETVTHFEPTQFAFVAKSHYFMAVGRGTGHHPTECSISPHHLWFEDIGWIFTCPGGPSPDHFGKIHAVENVTLNYFAPAVKLDHFGWISPAGRTCRQFKTESDRVRMVMDYEAFTLDRTIRFGEERLLFIDRFRFHTNRTLDELRPIHFPIVIDKFKIDLERRHEIRMFHQNRAVVLTVEDSDFPDQHFEILESIKTAKGLARVVALRLCDYAVKRNQEHQIQFKIAGI